MSDPDRLAAALGDLLAAEAEALRTGDLPALAAGASAREGLIAALTAAGPPAPAALGRLRALAERNAALAEAAAAGVRAARDRLEALARAAAGTDTYGGDGQRRRLANPAAPRLERRA